jgi:hypothetical protein
LVPAYVQGPGVHRLTAAAVALALALAPALGGETRYLGPDDRPLPFSSDVEALDFLRTAEVAEWLPVKEGTNPRKRVAVLRRGDVEAKAVFRFMYEHKPDAAGFLDSYLSEVAAYELATLLGFQTVPPVVLRRLDGRRGSLQLWIEGANTYAGFREDRAGAEDPEPVARRRDTLRVFDAFIANQDRNPGNLLLGPGEAIWWIDHTRSFGGGEELRGLESVESCDRRLWQALRDLEESEVRERLRPYAPYVDVLLERRRSLLAWLEARQAERGDAFFYDEPL